MKCPKCGREIEDGTLFCPYCFADIRIVPTYEANVENRIQETMKDIQKEVGRVEAREARLQKREKEIAVEKRRIFFIIVLIAALCALGIGGGVFLRYRQLHSVSHYIGLAYQASEDGNFEDAIQDIDRAMALGTGDAEDLQLLKAQYLQGAGKLQDAAALLDNVINGGTASDDELMAAYRQLISIYSSNEDYATIAKVLGSSENEDIQAAFSEYMVFTPTFDSAPGTYTGELSLTLKARGSGSIFYTIDGSEPTTKSLLYQGPILLKDGGYTVQAIYVNHFGAQSGVAEAFYQIQTKVPDAPEIDPASGTYTKPQSITVLSQDEGKVHYTTDGSNPTPQSPILENPLPIPEGTTTYRFAVIRDDGTQSETVARTYTYEKDDGSKEESAAGEANFPADAGTQFIYSWMMNHGSTIDGNGTLASGTARFVYSYEETRKIVDDRYYVYGESIVDSDGNSVGTGRTFVVNTLSGAVGILDGGGNITAY